MDIIKDKESKVSFIGLSLGGLSTTESAVAVLDKNLHVVLLDKLFSMNDVKKFFRSDFCIEGRKISLSGSSC